MHSRIYCFTDERDALEDLLENTPSEDSLYDCFSAHCDYVNEDTDLDEDFEWLCDYLQYRSKLIKIDKKEHSIKFLDGFEKEYFKTNFETLKEKIRDLTLEEFSSAHFNSYEITRLIEEDDFTFFMLCENQSYANIDDFIRTLKYVDNRKIYIYKSYDYHN